MCTIQFNVAFFFLSRVTQLQSVSLRIKRICYVMVWAFQVSQSSVETLFRWGKKRLHPLQCDKFYQNRPPFIGDITLPSENTIWSWRIFVIGCYLGIFTRCFCCVIVFYFTISMYLLRTFHPMFHCICTMLMSWFAFVKTLIKTTYLLTYLLAYLLTK